MAEFDGDTLYGMSDEELEVAFREAKASEGENLEVDGADGEDVDSVAEEDIDTEEENEEIEKELDAEEDNVEEDEDIEKEDEDEAEQPGDDEDSDETDQEDGNKDDEDENGKESDKEPDEDEEDNQDSDEDESNEPESAKVDPLEEFMAGTSKAKANGVAYEFTNKEKLEQFDQVFAQAANYTQKMQTIADWRKPILALKENGFTQGDVNTMIDVLKGDKDAIMSIIQKNNIDLMDMDAEQEVQYAPKEYGKSDQELAIDDVITTIEKDKEFEITSHVVDTQWDSKSRQTMAENPQMIAGLHNDIKSGVYDKVGPLAMKMKVLDGSTKSDLEYYVEAGAQYYAQLEEEQKSTAAREEAKAQTQAKEAERQKVEAEKVAVVKKRKALNTATQEAVNKRKAAAPTKKVAGKKDVIDYLDDSDQAFDDWYKRVQANMSGV